MSDDHLNPDPDDLDAVHERLRQIWSRVFATPLIYLLIGWILLALGWVKSAGAAIHPWDTTGARAALIGVAAADTLALIALRLSRRAALEAALPDREAALRRYHWIFYATLCLADGLSFIGLVYFCVSGQILGVLAGGVLTFIGYFLSAPRREDLASLE